MKATPMIQMQDTDFPGVKLFVPEVFEDDRGLLEETFSDLNYRDFGLGDRFVQDLVTWTSRNVIRGLHYDFRMAKFVQVLKGTVFDVIVDMRVESPQFKKWQGFYLSDHNHRQLYIPPGFAHGFLTLSRQVIFSYKMTAQHDLRYEKRILWDDPTVGIDWPLADPPRISRKDRTPNLDS